MKAKRILLFIIILLVIVAVAIGILYFKTDAQKFWKYGSKNMDVIELFNNQDMQDIRNKRSNNPYMIESKLNVRNQSNRYNITAKSSAQDSNNVITDVDIKYNDNDIKSHRKGNGTLRRLRLQAMTGMVPWWKGDLPEG